MTNDDFESKSDRYGGRRQDQANRARKAWATGQRERFVEFVHAQSCHTIAEFLARFPGEPYVTLASRLPVPIVPVQLIELQMEEAKQSGSIREAAKDALARALNRSLPEGWDSNPLQDFARGAAYAEWVGILRFRARLREPESAAWSVFSALRELDPPNGWRASGRDDPLIVQAFAMAWPVHHSSS